MIDAIDILFVEGTGQNVVQLARGIKIVTKRFFHDDARPAGAAAIQTRHAQSFNNGADLGSRRGSVKHEIRAGPGLLHLLHAIAQFGEELGLVEVAPEVVQALLEFLPGGLAKVPGVT